MELPRVDKAILESARKNIKAIDPVIRQYTPLIFHYGLGAKLPREKAEDVTQGCLLDTATAAALSKFDGQNEKRRAKKQKVLEYHRWVSSIVVNQVKDAWKLRKVDKAVHDPEGLILSMLPGGDDDPTRPAMVREMVRCLEEAFETLRTEGKTLDPAVFEKVFNQTTRGRIPFEDLSRTAADVALSESELSKYFEKDPIMEPFLDVTAPTPEATLRTVWKMKVGPLYHTVLALQRQGLTYQEIAKSLQVYESDVTNWRHAGMERLREFMVSKGFTSAGVMTMKQVAEGYEP